MDNLATYYSSPVKRGDVGIEVEVEAKKELPVIKAKKWNSKHDASLRGFCMEYMTDGPIPLSTVPDMLAHLSERINPSKPIETSPRTSVHVHKNCLKYSPLQIWTALCGYWILEELLFEYCGSYRKHNTFCLRLRDSFGIVQFATQDIKTLTPFQTFRNGDRVRYAGANLNALSKFGSLEFRGMRGTTDPSVLIPWIRSLSNMVDTFALEYDSPEDLLDKFIHMDKKTFLDRSVEPALQKFICDTVPNWKDLLDEGAERILPIAYITDWKKWATKQDVGLTRRKALGHVPALQAGIYDDNDLMPLRRIQVDNLIRQAVDVPPAVADF